MARSRLAAADTQSGSATLGVLLPSATSLVSITDAVLRSGQITLTATSPVNPASPTEKYIGLYANSTATVAVTDSAIEATGTGDATIKAESTVDRRDERGRRGRPRPRRASMPPSPVRS